MHAQPNAPSLALSPKAALPVWMALPALLAGAFALIAAAAAPIPATAVLTSASAPNAALPPVPAPVTRPEPPPPAPRPLGEEAPQPTVPDLELIIPVAEVAVSDLANTWGAARSAGRRHRGIDIMAPTGRPVLAAADGVVVRMVWNELGGRTIYQRDASGDFILYYAHLEGYAPGLEAGATVRQGDVIGFVGTTGNATTPHLHFEVMRQPNPKRWSGGKSFNPYAVLTSGAPPAQTPADAKS
jgi:peptidoglycan LD-endopeptidase LytH